jgi:hypothetical protein
LITARETSRNEILRQLPISKVRDLLSLHPITAAALTTMYRNGNLFVRHVVTEGKTLYDRGFYEALREEALPLSHAEMMREWELTKKRLYLYSNPSIFNYLFKECLSRIYHLACRFAIVASTFNDSQQFNKDKALDRLLQSFPNLDKEVRVLRELRRFSVRRYRSSSDEDESLKKIPLAFVKQTIRSLERVIVEVESSDKFKDH